MDVFSFSLSVPQYILASGKGFVFLEAPLVHTVMAAAGIGVLCLCIWLALAYRTRIIEQQRMEYKDVTGQIMSVISALADSKNEYTAGHSRRVAAYSDMIGRRMGLTEDELELLSYAALLHDIGKISVPDHILNKNGRLTDEEFEVIKNHVVLGGELLSTIVSIKDIASTVRCHHENVDGTGYVDGLKGDEIPVASKIISVSNAFDAMISDRPYRKALPMEHIKSELIKNAGKQFDEMAAASLIALIDEGVVPLL